MKHDLKITILLVIFFLAAQIIGLALIGMDITGLEVVDGKTIPVHQETSLGPRPEVSGSGAFIYIAAGLAIGTLLVLLIIKSKKVNLWRIWFFLAVFIAISLALGVIMAGTLAMIIALILAGFKVFKPNIIIHNITELLMYAGIAVFLVPLLNVLWAGILLAGISLYDVYAVFKSKHMVKMAKFQAKSKVFAGLFIPYTPEKKGKKGTIKKPAKILQPPKALKAAKKRKDVKTAVLGGGDIAFPLLFSGSVMESLVSQGASIRSALQQSLIITIACTAAIALLFIFAKKQKFYPAMPFVSAGCLLGYVIVLLI